MYTVHTWERFICTMHTGDTLYTFTVYTGDKLYIHIYYTEENESEVFTKSEN